MEFDMAVTIEAVILDMDGLLLDTEPVARRAWTRAAEEHGYSISDELYIELVGRDARDVARKLIAAFGEGFPIEKCRTRRDELYDSDISAHGIPLKPGVIDILDYLAAAHMTTAVATSTYRDLAIQKLHRAGIISRFDVIVAGDEIRRGKPFPDIFLATSNRLGLVPESCLVLEDSLAGVQAAHQANMTVIMVPDLIPPNQEVRTMAYAVTDDLKEAKGVVSKLLVQNDQHKES
jgi:HAD superfamily hydrolase (TIGR01509 family)